MEIVIGCGKEGICIGLIVLVIYYREIIKIDCKYIV